ncbi:hypothetical protein THAOC_01594 [Thalassiosira oceanica]|uniref:Uncharacterized protein n=1 Tax=Thalassiosira oceanica TaxID=159749 RepID=K0TD82_THAOC|nr:hypothetical protein THAOC_01594 [Thalassiosira oceanica]|eukprot:EJK76633.1 hypothetical protein THAOC_01594 [Thalassiosira oceanica]
MIGWNADESRDPSEQEGRERSLGGGGGAAGVGDGSTIPGGVVLHSPFLSVIRVVLNVGFTTYSDMFPNIDRMSRVRDSRDRGRDRPVLPRRGPLRGPPRGVQDGSLLGQGGTAQQHRDGDAERLHQAIVSVHQAVRPPQLPQPEEERREPARAGLRADQGQVRIVNVTATFGPAGPEPVRVAGQLPLRARSVPDDDDPAVEAAEAEGHARHAVDAQHRRGVEPRPPEDRAARGVAVRVEPEPVEEEAPRAAVGGPEALAGPAPSDAGASASRAVLRRQVEERGRRAVDVSVVAGSLEDSVQAAKRLRARTPLCCRDIESEQGRGQPVDGARDQPLVLLSALSGLSLCLCLDYRFQSGRAVRKDIYMELL